MTDEKLLQLNQSGFIPGPLESAPEFERRVLATQQSLLKIGDESIPSSHWTYVKVKLQNLFGFAPDCLPAFYSNRALTPWQGAAAWVENGQVIAIQLRKAFQKGTFLKLYDRDEILGHEAVHAARSAFPKDPWDEFFAYMTSDKKWRKALGPIVQNPWEVWPFLLLCLLGSLFSPAFLGAALWVSLGFFRLIRFHRILRRASCYLKDLGYDDKNIRAILLRLTDEEIRKLAQKINLFETFSPDDPAPRMRLIRLAYIQGDLWRKK